MFSILLINQIVQETHSIQFEEEDDVLQKYNDEEDIDQSNLKKKKIWEKCGTWNYNVNKFGLCTALKVIEWCWILVRLR